MDADAAAGAAVSETAPPPAFASGEPEGLPIFWG